MGTKIWPAHHIGTVVGVKITIRTEETAPPNPNRRTGFGRLELLFKTERAELLIWPHGTFDWGGAEVSYIRWRKSVWRVEGWGWGKRGAYADPLTFELVKTA